MSRRFYRTKLLGLALCLCLTLLSPTASSAVPARSSAGPPAYSLTYTTRQVEGGGVVYESIVKVYRDGDAAAVTITNLPNPKLPRGIHDLYVMDLRAHKSREWSPHGTACSVTDFSGDSWPYNPFAGPLPFKGLLNPLLDKSLPFQGHRVGTDTVIGLETQVFEITSPPSVRSKLWVEPKSELVLKTAKLGKDGRYHVDSTVMVTKFSTGRPAASVFAPGGPCGGSAAASGGNETGTSAPAAEGSSGITVPAGSQLEIKWKDGSPLKLKAPEEVAFIMLASIHSLQEQCQLFFQRFCTLPELEKGMKTSQGVIGLSVTPAQDENYHYAVGISGKELGISARPARPGIGGWMWIQHEFGHDLYFNPQGTATGRDKEIGDFSLAADYVRH